MIKVVDARRHSLKERWTYTLLWVGDRMEDIANSVSKCFGRVNLGVHLKPVLNGLFDATWSLGLLIALDAVLSWPQGLSMGFVIPVGYATYRHGTRAGAGAAVLTLLAAIFVDVQRGHDDSPLLIQNFVLRLLVLSAILAILHSQQLRIRQSNEVALKDALTGAANRIGIERYAGEIIDTAIRTRQTVSIAMVDCDNFKQLNDTHGHAYGDQVLKTLVRHLSASIQSGGIVGRSGGDEFIVILPGRTPEQARKELKSAQDLFRGATILMGAKADFTFGLAELGKNGMTLTALLASADQEMYDKKVNREVTLNPVHTIGI